MSEMLVKQELIADGVLKQEETSFKQMKENVALQEKWNRAIEKMKDYLVDAIAPILEKIVNWFSDPKNYEGFVGALQDAAGWIKDLVEKIQSIGIKNTVIGGLGLIGAGVAGYLALKMTQGTMINPTKVMEVGPGALGGAGRFGGRMAKGGMMNMLPGGSRHAAAMRMSQMGKLGMSRGMGGAMGMGAAAGFGAAGMAVQHFGNKFADGFEEEGDLASAKAMDIGSGALQGAAYGAALGSVVPVVGTAAGAIIGTAVGLISGAVEASDRQRRAEMEKIAQEEKERKDASDGMLQALMDLNYMVKEGGNVYMDGNKVGTSTVMADVRVQ